MSRRRFHLIFWSLVSLAIHFVYFVGLTLVPTEWLERPHRSSETAVEVDLVTPKTDEEKNKNEKQFVRQTEPEDSMLVQSKEKARFMSEKDQRVLLETRARETGLSKNRTQEPRFLRQAREEKLRNMPPQKKIMLSQTGLDYSQFKPLDVKKEIADLGSSTVGEVLPKDVSIGSFTALNTDRFTFYSFYARIEELVRFRWETKVKEAVDGFSRHFMLSQVLQKNWVTEVEFLLSPNGEFRQAKVKRESGIAKFDLATVWAFRDARIFPNPPQEMVQPDGFIHLYYTFNVQLNPSVMAEQ